MPDEKQNGLRPVRLKDVAAHAEVSLAAASRVLNGDTTLRIGDERRQRIVDAAALLNYSPTYAARALRMSMSSTIALMVPDVNSAIFSEVSRGAESAASEMDLTVLLASSNQMTEDSGWVDRVVGQGRVDGLILQPSDDISRSAMHAVLKRDLRLVLMNSVGDGDISTVRLDDEAGIATAVQHLAQLGHTHVAFLNGNPNNETARRRLTGFLLARARLGLVERPEWILHQGYNGQDGRDAVSAILAVDDRPTALVVANVNSALGAIAELHSRGVRVPEEMSVIAYHDVWYADSIWPPLSTVRTPLFEMGRSAVRTLMGFSSSDPVLHVVITDPAPQLIERASTQRVGAAGH